jgi:hypothetical protein
MDITKTLLSQLGDVFDIVGGLTGGGSGKKSSGGLGGMLGKLFGS